MARLIYIVTILKTGVIRRIYMSLKFTQTSYKPGNSFKLTITSTGSVRTSPLATYFNTISLVGTSDFWYRCGSSTVTAAAATSTGAASKFIPAGTVLYVNKDEGARYVAAIANAASGIVVVGEESQ